MDSYIALTLFGCFFVLVFIGVPISFSIGIATVASMLLMFPWDIAAITVSQRLANGLDNFALLAIPFFIFAGTLMNSGGIAIRLINLAQVMVGRVSWFTWSCERPGEYDVWFHFWFSRCGSCCRWWHTESHSDQRRL